MSDATGYQQRLQAVINSFVSAKEQEYQTYWQFRNGQTDPSVFDVGRPGSVCVNRNGDRFVDESCSYDLFGKGMVDDQLRTGANTPCWHVFDALYRAMRETLSQCRECYWNCHTEMNLLYQRAPAEAR